MRFLCIGWLLVVTLALAACGGGHPAAFSIVSVDRLPCGVFTSAECYEVTIRNSGDAAGQATCSLNQYTPGVSVPKVRGEEKVSPEAAPGETVTVQLSMVPQWHKGYTRPRPSCGPGIPTDS